MLTLIFLTDLDSCPESTLILVSIDLETEPPILVSDIPLMGRECEFQFFDLDSTIEPIPTLEPTLDFFKLVMVPEPITHEPSQRFHQVTFYCWTKVVTIMTQ